ncbi:TetR/AcrR family transcriptional regulator C-terminal domain-containing protein [Actinoplanes sp. KI2]|uniref:TetR/AcrR family transcriptional regulator C-terminal domain-containing protein n=1 Tax=Actinoplanes sp. KI2 TaxID=2983315 RepID=UPI0021D57C28|nr:TetR/AcrR family transcriptional regulator C-terminal domain-containing protein [Actinoplanes sp. KI2]MCU7724656.1 TetR/AcrR family transcriptional regulator C-terminal domain-containing protein [Actinoplanes sp. KI2]
MKGLSREVLIETGLRLLDEVGLDGLTVRRLATELGVRSPALYWHIKTKQELLDGMADVIIQGAGMGPPWDGESWQEWLRRRARGYRRSLLAHRDGARVVASARRMPGALGEFEGELSAMVALGFTPVLALRTITALANYLNGYVLQEQAGVEAGDPDAGDLLAAMPTLAAALRAGGNPMDEASFEHGLTLLIAGTEAQVMA